MTNGSNHRIYANLTRSVKLNHHGQGEVKPWWPWFRFIYWPGQVGITFSDYYLSSLTPYTRQSVQFPIWLIEWSVTFRLFVSTCFYWEHKWFTCSVDRNSQSSSTNHQYATLMSLNQGKTVLCGSSTFVGWLGRRSLVAANRTWSPWPWFSITDLVRLA